MAKQLGPLLEKGEAGNAGGETAYDATYRVQPTFAVHANLATIGAYLKYADRAVWRARHDASASYPASSEVRV